MKNYKTIHENKNDLEQFNAPKEIIIKLPEKLNMEGIQEFLENQRVLNTNDYWTKQINKLDKYDAIINYDCPTMSKEEDGEYVKLEDVLNLFSAEKQ